MPLLAAEARWCAISGKAASGVHCATVEQAIGEFPVRPSRHSSEANSYQWVGRHTRSTKQGIYYSSKASRWRC